MIPTIPKKYIKLVFHIFWPFIWPLRPSLAFFNFFEVLEVLEVQWHALVTYLTLLSSERIIVENFPFLITVAKELEWLGTDDGRTDDGRTEGQTDFPWQILL